MKPSLLDDRPRKDRSAMPLARPLALALLILPLGVA